MNAFYSIELPHPPRGKTPPLDQLHKIEPVLINTIDGKSISGELVSYSPNLDSISIKNNGESEPYDIKINKIKTLQLVNSRQFVLADEFTMEQASDISMPSERQEYEILFNDGSNDIGETLGNVTDNNGVHLFVAQAFNNYVHIFIPFSAMKDHRIGAFLGQILVQKKVVTQEQLGKGLELQKEFRTQKLGDILKDKAIVSTEQLESVLKKQQARPNIRLGEALIQDGIISEEQLNEALQTQKQNRNKPLGEILTDMGAVSVVEIRKTLASKLGIPFVNLRKFNIEANITDHIPVKIARRHHIMPLCIQENKLIIAIEDPMNRTAVEDIRFHTKIFVEPIMATDDDIEWAINHHYGAQISDLAEELTLVAQEDDEDEFDTEVTDSDNALVKIVNKMIMDAYQAGASDIHIEPSAGKKKLAIRFRKDGSLQSYVELPASYRNALVSRIKIMCDLDISERRKPQDGKIEFRKFGPANIELRVATLPTAGGVEDVVLRVLSNGEPLPLEKMNLNTYNHENIVSLISKPYGLFLVCGPTGSGKTTTLHSILKYINTPDRKIWTAEDPVEITQQGLRQVQVNPKIDLTFANAMRAFLRADPDVIMVGEMRDGETTSMGIEASLTGHLVFSTLHTNSAPESIVRLLDMGMDPFNFADALLGILAQRLAKSLCKRCKTTEEASEEELHSLAKEYCSELNCTISDEETKTKHIQDTIEKWHKQFANAEGKIMLSHAKGCDECKNTGYNGRIPLHELLVASNTIKSLIQDHAKVMDILAAATSEGMLTLKQDGIEKVLKGMTDILQVHAVCIK